MKTCKKCNLPKPVESFTVDVRYKDGRYPWCFECRRAWRQSRKDQYREYQRDWKEQNRDHVRAYEREYFQNNDEQREKNRAAGRIRDRERYQSDSEHRKKKNRQTAEKNRRRKALLYGIETEHHTEQEWLDLCAYYDHRCLCCGEQKPLSRDHVVPVTSGGLDTIANIQPLCKECNSRKNNRTVDFRPGWEAEASHPTC